MTGARIRLLGPATRGWRGDSAGPVLLLPLAFQVGVLPAASLVYVGGYGTAGSRPMLVLCAVLMVVTAALGFGAARGVPLRMVLVGDTVVAVAGNLALSVVSLPSDRTVEVSWQYFAGCVALWTMVRGVPAGLAAAAGGIPLRLAMFAASGPVHTVRSATVSALGDALVLVLAVVVAGAVLVLLDQNAERLRTGIRRSLHDTVLQTLEAIALTLPNDAEQAPRRLQEVRAVAHAEAVALRRQLSRPAGVLAEQNLVEGLVGLVTELARDGLRVRLDAAEVDHAALTARRRATLLAATREALRNVLKHAGVTDALVRAAEDEEGGLTLIVRDFGVGFDPAAHRPGFGLSESIAARMAEVGGTASIGSRPGLGTSVTLRVPLEADAVV